MKPVRVRFAPSPTGPLHIGGLRTALYNYLFAKKHNGTFILRIEDTDQTRFVPGAEAYITEALSWAGIEPDESPSREGDVGPYRQSERRELYQQNIRTLIDNGSAYYAFDTPEEIDAMRKRLEAEGVHSPKYNHETRDSMRNSLTLSEEQVSALLEEDAAYTIRLKVQPGQTISFTDTIRESVSFSSSELDDKVLMKSDGLPTYHLANVIDDYHMKISHVIRGEEWLSSTAHHVLLYRAFGWEDDMPTFAHLPLLLKPTGKGKLSKRDGMKLGIPVFPMNWQAEEGLYPGFREMGFLPQACINFLAFLGWNPGTEKEMYSLTELIEDFSLENVSKGGARFDFDKAKWFNQQYILQADQSLLVEVLASQLAERKIERDAAFLDEYVELFRPRIESLNDLYSAGNYFFEDIQSFNEKMVRKKWKEKGQAVFNDVIQRWSTVADWSGEGLKNAVQESMASHEAGFGDILPLLRIALTGDVKGADLFATASLMGPELTMQRLQAAGPLFDQIKS